MKPNLIKIEMKLNLNPNPNKIDEKWDKNKNNGFGFDGQNLIIKSQHFEWKSMKNQWKLNEISGKILTNF